MVNNNNGIDEISVKNIFKDANYIIPIYQRNYAWGQEEIEKLIEDISDFNSRGNDYFLGNLIVDEIGPQRYSVIDGQQRLTTLFLLLIYLVDPSISEDSLSFEVRDKSNMTLKNIYRSKTAEFESNRFASPSIISGFNIIEQYFGNKGIVKEDFEKKLDNIKLVRIQVPKDIDLNNYFEIMNTRGEQLELHEIAKARILEKIEEKDREIAANIWDACSNMNYYVQMNFDTDVRSKLFSSKEYKWDQFLCEDFDDIVKKIGSKSDKNNSSTMLEMLGPDDKNQNERKEVKSEEEKNRFSSIIDFPNFLLQVNAAIGNQTKEDQTLDDKYFLKTLENNWSSKESAKEFIYKMLLMRFEFDKFIVKREDIDDVNNQNRWSLKKLYGSNKSSQYKNTFEGSAKNEQLNEQLLKLQASMRTTFTSPKTMHWITEVIKLPLGKLESADNIISVLEKYCCDQLGKGLKKGLEEYEGFDVPRLMFTYLDYILWRDNYIDKGYKWKIGFRTSIEHFSPQHPADGKAPWDGDKLNGFGNLALISVESNSKFSNLAPGAKISTYESVFEQSPKLQLMKKMTLDNRNVWTPEESEKLATQMYDILSSEIKCKANK